MNEECSRRARSHRDCMEIHLSLSSVGNRRRFCYFETVALFFGMLVSKSFVVSRPAERKFLPVLAFPTLQAMVLCMDVPPRAAFKADESMTYRYSGTENNRNLSTVLMLLLLPGDAFSKEKMLMHTRERRYAPMNNKVLQPQRGSPAWNEKKKTDPAHVRNGRSRYNQILPGKVFVNTYLRSSVLHPSLVASTRG